LGKLVNFITLVKYLITNIEIVSVLMKKLLFFCFFLSTFGWSQQNIALYNQFNGRYDFTFVGNTLNPVENSFQDLSNVQVFTSSSANLNLLPTDQIESAYLYWAGCGTGDLNIKLNNVDIVAERTFSNVLNFGPGFVFNYFSAFTNVTNQVKATGNGTYTVSELDVSAFIDFHSLSSTNFAGWAMIVVYKNPALPLNQLNIYDGLQVVSGLQNNLDINLDALNVIDNQDAKIGFLAWEGDSGLAVNETLRINGNIISNPPLNPANNAFNGTNSITGSASLNNMDLDIYGIQNNINIGDTSALIQLTSGQDYVMVNAIVTKLNSQLPDARITFETPSASCNSRNLTVNYTVTNTNSTANLPVNTPISFYADNVLIGSAFTQNVILIDGQEMGSINLNIPNGIPLNFNLIANVDDSGTGSGVVTEIIENNNSFSLPIRLLISPEIVVLDDITSCNLGYTKGLFDFEAYFEKAKANSTNSISFHETQIDAEQNTNAILNTNNFLANATPKQIWYRTQNTDGCFSVSSFFLRTKNCPPIVYNAISPNGDGKNDTFFIEGLRTIFVNFELDIYNRYGRLLWKGNDNKPDWSGEVEYDKYDDNKAPSATYYYVLKLNDPDYPEPITGFLLLKR
jgi:gliding motility-associated-like protein